MKCNTLKNKAKQNEETWEHTPEWVGKLLVNIDGVGRGWWKW